MSGRIDVLAVMRQAPCRCLSVAQLGERDRGCDRCRGIAAVAELIAADRELDSAYAEFPPVGRCTPAQIDAAAARINAALHRRSAALAAVGGAA